MKRHLPIYCLGLLLSVIFISLYFINTEKGWCILCCSVGASLIGAVCLAFFLELADNLRDKKEIQKYRCQKLRMMRDYLTRGIDIVLKKFVNLHKQEFDHKKNYAFNYNDIKQILIEDFTQYEIQSIEQGIYNKQTRNEYVDGFKIFNQVLDYVKNIVNQEDLFIINKIFSHEEMVIFNNVNNSNFIINKDNLESVIYDVTFIIDEMLAIPEFFELKDYYLVWISELNKKILINNKTQKMILRPVGNLTIDFDESIMNGKDYINSK